MLKVCFYLYFSHKHGGNREAQERVAVVFSREEDPDSHEIKIKRLVPMIPSSFLTSSLIKTASSLE